jgi:hypothetical protein
VKRVLGKGYCYLLEIEVENARDLDNNFEAAEELQVRIGFEKKTVSDDLPTYEGNASMDTIKTEKR